MKSDITFERTHQEFAPLGQLVDFPVTLLFGYLNHALFTEFLQVGVHVAAAQSEGVCEVVAVGRLVAESLQDTEFGLRDKTHFSEIADPQRIRRDYGTTESQQKQTSNRRMMSGHEDYVRSPTAMKRRTYLAGLAVMLAGCAETGDGPDGDSSEDTTDGQNQDTPETTDVSSVIEIVEEESGVDPAGSNDAAPGYHEYEIKNTGDETVSVYVHVVFYDGDGNEVLCNSYYHILPPGESDSEYTNPASINFAEAEIVDIVEQEEDGHCG